MPSVKKAIHRYISIAERWGLLRWMPTELYLKYKFRRITGKRLNLDNPRTLNEKLQKLKLLYATSPELPTYTQMADKIASKDFVAQRIGPQYIIPTLGVWRSVDEIPFDDLPDRFVLKTNHDSGGVVVCTDKSTLDIPAAKRKLRKSLRRNFYWFGREPQYKHIPPRVFAEAYLEDPSEGGMKDYKFWCFHGVPKMIEVDLERSIYHTRNLFTTDWTPIEAQIGYPPNHKIQGLRPDPLDVLLRLAAALSAQVPFLRVDFYCIENHIYSGELTFFHASGTQKFTPESLGVALGDLLQLP